MMSVASANRTSGRNLSLHVLYTAVKVLHHSTNIVLIKYTYMSVGNLVDTNFSAMRELVKAITTTSLPHALYKLQIFLMQLL